jgi:hypothetical protein
MSLASPPSPATRIAARLLLAWVLLVVAGMALTTGKSVATAGDIEPSLSASPTVIAEPGHADRDGTSCLKAPSPPLLDESGMASGEAEPELTLPGSTLERTGLAPYLPFGLHDAACVARKTARLSRGPPLQA